MLSSISSVYDRYQATSIASESIRKNNTKDEHETDLNESITSSAHKGSTGTEGAFKVLSNLKNTATFSAPPSFKYANEIFDELDSNDDGGIDISEFSSVASNDDEDSDVTELFNKLDSNGDGVIDEIENEEALGNMPPPPPPPPPANDTETSSDTESLLSELDRISSLLNEVKNALTDSDDEAVNESIQSIIEQFKNNIGYSQDGSSKVNSSGIQSLLSMQA